MRASWLGAALAIILTAFSLALTACLGHGLRPTPSPLPAPQGLIAGAATPTSAPTLAAPAPVVGIGDRVIIGGLLVRTLAFQLPDGQSPAGADQRDAIVQVWLRLAVGPSIEVAPQSQMALEDEQGRRYQLSPPAAGGEDGEPFRLEVGQERELHLSYQLPREVQRVAWVLLTEAGEAVLRVDFGSLPPSGP